MTVAVITPVAGRTDHLTRLLDGLTTQHRPPDETIVVDLAPYEPAVRRCTAGRPGVRPVSYTHLTLPTNREV